MKWGGGEDWSEDVMVSADDISGAEVPSDNGCEFSVGLEEGSWLERWRDNPFVLRSPSCLPCASNLSHFFMLATWISNAPMSSAGSRFELKSALTKACI